MAETQPQEETIVVNYESTPPEIKNETSYKLVDGALWLFIDGKWINAAPKFKVGAGTIPATNGKTSITGLGFKPKLIRINAAASSGSGAYSSFGSTDGTTEYCIWVYSGSHFRVAELFYVFDGSGSAHGHLESIDEDGFTLHCANNTLASNFYYEAFG